MESTPKDTMVSPQATPEEENISRSAPFLVPQEVQHQVVELPCETPISIFGQVFEGIDGLKSYCYREQTDESQPYVLDRCKLFPCFDYEDYANECRFYRNYLICRSKKEADRKVQRLEQLKTGNDFCLVHDELPNDMRPMVYYRDESRSMLLAY